MYKKSQWIYCSGLFCLIRALSLIAVQLKVAISETAVAAAPDVFGRDVSSSCHVSDFSHPDERKEGELTTGELQMGSSKQVNRCIVGVLLHSRICVLKMEMYRTIPSFVFLLATTCVMLESFKSDE